MPSLAVFSLMDHLRERKIGVAIVGYTDRNNGHLIVQLRDLSQALLVPLNWHGYRVRCEKEPS